MLSDLRIRSLKPGAKDVWKADGRNGLYIRVRATGGKSFVVRRTIAGRAQPPVTLGPYSDGPGVPGLTLAEARTKAAALAGRPVSNVTLSELLEDWYSQKVEKRYRRPHHVRGYIDRLGEPLKATKLRDLERLVVTRALRRYAEDRGPVAAMRALSILKTALAYAVDCGYVERSPIDGLDPENVGRPEAPRERTLTDAEIRALWTAESSHAPLLRFLLLTGQRIGEAQRMAWEHVQGDRWHIPEEHSKNGRAHWVALCPAALELLGEKPEGRALVFGSRTTTGVQAWLRRWCEREKVVPAFTPHDLRRTFSTRLGDLGVAPHVIEKILNHTMQGVMAVYNRSEYETERVAAMQAWADELAKVLKHA